MGTRLYVGNLAFSTTHGALEELFASVGGGATDVHLVTDRMTGQSRGFAFVTMSTEEDAQAAIEQLDGQMFEGRPLRVNEAQERRPRPGGGGGGRGPGGGGGGGGGGGRGGPRGGGGGGGKRERW